VYARLLDVETLNKYILCTRSKQQHRKHVRVCVQCRYKKKCKDFPALCGRTADPADVSGTISGHAEKTASKGHGCFEVTLCID